MIAVTLFGVFMMGFSVVVLGSAAMLLGRVMNVAYRKLGMSGPGTAACVSIALGSLFASATSALFKLMLLAQQMGAGSASDLRLSGRCGMIGSTSLGGIMKTRMDQLIARARREAGKWLATATGGFYFLERQNERDISVVDIAIGMARKCRYSGNIRIDREHYSVAEHSDLMARKFEEDPSVFLGDEPMMLEDYLKMKFHDGTEFVFPDVPTPLKDMFPAFRTIEGYHDEKIESAIIPNPAAVRITKPNVKEFDIRIRTDERRYLIAEPAFSSGHNSRTAEPLGVTIRCLDWREAAWGFLEDFVRAVDAYPARDPENQKRALEQRALAARFLADNPRPPSRNELMDRVAELEAELASLRSDDLSAPGM